MNTQKHIHKIPVQRSRAHGFYYGNCATLAIAGAYEADTIEVGELFKLIGEHPNHGVSERAINKIIRFLSTTKRKPTPVYVPNTQYYSIFRFVNKIKKGEYLVSFDEHLAHYVDGVFYDNFILENTELVLTKREIRKIVGWWKINDEKEENFTSSSTSGCTSASYWSYG